MSKIPSKQSNLSVVPKPSNDLAGRSKEDDSSVCPKCLGSGMEIVAGKGARQCACQKQASRAKPFDKVRVPRRYLNCHFNSYEPVTDKQKMAVRFATQFTHNFPANDRGILFMGPVGVGKTHLAVSILMGLVETKSGFSYLFYEFGSLLKEIQESFNPNTQTSEISVLSPVLNADLLVLDELGVSKPTAWVKETIAHIINSRYNENKLTIFTTNYVDSRADSKAEILEERIGVSMRSRLYEMCKTIEIDGADYRKVKFDGSSARS